MDQNQKLTAIREEEAEKRSRAAALASEASNRELTGDEMNELAEIEVRVGQLADQSTAIQRALKVGAFHRDLNQETGLSEKEIRQFSILNLIKAHARGATQKDRDNATLELEASREVEQRIGVAPRGFYLPMEIMGSVHVDDPRKARRDLKADTFSGAGALVGVDFRPDQMIPLLRNQMALNQLGPTYLDGLVGDVAIPKQTGTATSGWIGSDGGTIGESDQTVAQVTLTPRSLGVFTDYSRQLRLQSSVSVENFIRQDLSRSIALAMDVAAFHGTGTNGQPLGIENTTGIGTQSFATPSNPTRAEIVGMRSDIATANALVGNLAFATDSTVYSNMMKTLVDAGSGQFLLNENGVLIGRPVVESNQITAGQVFFGNWADLLVAQWGSMDIMIDPYTGATAGNTRVLIFSSMDIAVRHAESFTLGQ